VTVRLRVLAVAAVLGVLAALLVACGDRSRLIPSGDAGRLQGDLDNLQNVVSSGDCERIRATLQRLQDDLVQLPSTVDIRLRNRIQEGVAALVNQAPEACAQAQADTTTTDTTTTETTETTETTDTSTETTDTSTETTPTETTPTDTTPTETAPTETTPPPTEGTGGTGVPPGDTTP
jgi:cell division septation protein DedD